jgi:uncharacterized membrane protein required for colicin V production
MNALDAILVLLVLAPAALGLWKGIVEPACALASLAAGGCLALRKASQTASLLTGWGLPERWAPVAAFLALFLLAVVLGAVVSLVAIGLLRRVRLRWLDRLLGAGIGFLAGTLAAAVVVTACAGLWPEGEGLVRGSLLAPHVLRGSRDLLLPTLPGEWRDRLDPLLEPARPPRGDAPAA